MLEEAQVIALVQAGEVDAFAEIVEHYQVPIHRYLYRMTGDYEMARDLAQDTFLQAYQSIIRTNADLSLKAWLYRIATNNALQFRRRKRLISFIPFSSIRNVETLDRDCDVETEKNLAIQEALHKVPKEQRVCLVLNFIEGFKYREIAEILGISEEAVRKRVTRGRKLFIEQYNRGGGGKA